MPSVRVVSAVWSLCIAAVVFTVKFKCAANGWSVMVMVRLVQEPTARATTQPNNKGGSTSTDATGWGCVGAAEGGAWLPALPDWTTYPPLIYNIHYVIESGW